MEERERARHNDDLTQAEQPGPTPPILHGSGAFLLSPLLSASAAVTQPKQYKPIAIYHEHPDWFRPLFEELDRRGLPFVRLDAAAHVWDPSERESPYSVVVNRASPSAYLRGHAQSTFHTLHWLKHLERLGVPVVNGSAVYTSELSKALQLDILEELGLPYPRARVINHASQAPRAARGLRFPVVLKANIGGSGAGIVRFDTPEALAQASRDELLDLRVDHTALIQELAPLRDGHITRVEVLGGKFLYAIKVYPAEGAFNLCPADVCRSEEHTSELQSRQYLVCR